MANKKTCDFLTPGVSEATYNSFTMDEKNVFDLITTQGGGVRGIEIKEQLGIGFEERKRIINALHHKGAHITQFWSIEKVFK
ncbi:hypothetical protein [Planococcus wigleyi]|uniref:DNA-binding protein n=1 Tax=Planococcus wigleyi TaxID=2762216 RepID=A0ABR8WDF2_9BACL|nr:hypothetical protein [Planococcus wigleyi]MBD8015039.1 hypothetical protein [Planococcus wigleyi]